MLATKPDTSGSRHFSRGSTPSVSKVAPPPTITKSSRQDSDMRATTLVSAASRLSTTILRPLMPPRSLHHCSKTSAVSKNSWFRPGRPAKATSENVATWIGSGVKPVVGDPDGDPLWHTSVRSPKVADFAPDPPPDAAVVVVDPRPSSPESLRLHADANRARHASTTAIRFISGPPGPRLRWLPRSSTARVGMLVAGSDVHAAVDAEDLTRHVAAGIRAEERARRRDVVRRAGPAERDHRADHVDAREVARGFCGPGHRGVDKARSDRVDGDALAGEVDRERLGERDHPALRRRVVGHVGGTRLRARRRDRHDAPPTRGDHVGDRGLRAGERPGEVHRDDPVPLLAGDRV